MSGTGDDGSGNGGIVAVLVTIVVWVRGCGSEVELFGDWNGECGF